MQDRFVRIHADCCRLVEGVPHLLASARDESGNLLWCNEEYAAVFQLSPSDLVGEPLARMMPPHAAEERLVWIREAIEGRQSAAFLQIMFDRLCLSRAWLLDPDSWSSPGCLFIMHPVLMSVEEMKRHGLNYEFRGAPVFHTLARLSRRELEVFRLAAEGLTARAIATMLHRSVRTVENHCQRILNKLELGGRSGLARFAAERGLLCIDHEQWLRVVESAFAHARDDE